MTDLAADVARIAAALERLSPPLPEKADLATGDHFHFDGQHIHTVSNIFVLPLERFVGVDHQIESLLQNFKALARGAPAHDTLLWGSRGMGKSALLRTTASEAGVALVEARGDQLDRLPILFRELQTAKRPFLVYIDDLAFTAADQGVRQLRSLLDGGVEARPDHVRIAVTSNHRHLVDVPPTNSESVRHARDVADDQLALVDRFGLVLGFHVPDQDQYLEMVRRHLGAEGLEVDERDALAFAQARGGRSGRTAWHYRNEMMARKAIAGN